MKICCLHEKCINCGQCALVLCPMGEVRKTLQIESCIGCGACILACPQKAIDWSEEPLKKSPELPEKNVYINGQKVKASGLIKDALIAAGIKISCYPMQNNKGVFMPCCTGGCWTCAVKADEKYALSCLTPLYNNMHIEILENPPPLRVVSGFGAHTVGGVGTPYYLKKGSEPIEIACFTHGCNLRCPQCQNFGIAFTAGGHLMGSEETAQILIGLKTQYNVDRVALSGGESTLNREWLIEVIRIIHQLDPEVHIHVDTNGTIITPDYIDALVDAGMTEIGVDLKAIQIPTFMHITGISDEILAEKYLKTSWCAVKHIINHHTEIFMGIGIPYNKALISAEEVHEMGQKIAAIQPDVQVCLMDYRGEFRRKNLSLPSFHEMIGIKDILNKAGLKMVIAQTPEGHIGP